MDNISGDDLALTSGTIIQLIREVFPKLPEQWGLDDIDIAEKGNRSLSIVQDFIDITSDLYHQQYAWSEMNPTTKGRIKKKVVITIEFSIKKKVNGMKSFKVGQDLLFYSSPSFLILLKGSLFS